MHRFLILLGLHFLVSFVLLPDNVLVSHPVHHDDYLVLGASLDAPEPIRVRPISGLLIATFGDLGPTFAYIAFNMLVVLCLWLTLRFVELFARDGSPLPLAGYAAAAILALAFPSMVDWTKYFGLLTNLASALFGLSAMCVFATIRLEPGRALPLGLAAFVLVVLSFGAKEDFALPVLGTLAGLALAGNRVRWTIVAAAVGAMFAGALAWNRHFGSVFVSGMRRPDDAYFVDLAPASLWNSFAKMFLAHGFTCTLLVAALVAVGAALVLSKGGAEHKLRLLLLPAIALSVLAPYTIFPNHAFAYYGWLPAAMLAATFVTASYAALDRRGD
jgi:hypothetical protein